MISIKFWQNVNQKLSKFITKECFVVRPFDCLCKVSKIFTEFHQVINFEKFLIYVLPKFS